MSAGVSLHVELRHLIPIWEFSARSSTFTTTGASRSKSHSPLPLDLTVFRKELSTNDTGRRGGE